MFLVLSSLGTALLMTRFISLMAKAAGDEKPGVQLPWAVSVALSAAFLWLWHPAAGWPGYSISLKAVMLSLGPVVIGIVGGLALSRVVHPQKTLIPPGDVWCFLESLWARHATERRRRGVRQRRDTPRRLPSGYELLTVLERGSQTWSFIALTACFVGAVLFALAILGAP